LKTLAQVDALIKSKRESLKALTAPFISETGDVLEGFPIEESKSARLEIDTLTAEFKVLEDARNIVVENAEALKAQNQSTTTFSQGTTVNVQAGSGTKALTLPAQAMKYRGKSFKKANGSPDPESAYKAGMWLAATLKGDAAAIRFCKDFGLPLVRDTGDTKSSGGEYKVGIENVNASGGFLVPDILDNAIIDLREKFGVFEPNAKRSVMTSDVKRVPRRTGGLTAYYVGEDATITDSTKGWDSVTLVAKKLACLAKYSSELNEDAIIDIGNDLAQEIAYAFAAAQDDAGFNGDGTSTYGGIVGLSAKFLALSGTIANIAGLVVATGTGYATNYNSVVLSDLNSVKGKLPKYARDNDAAWYCNQFFYDSVMEKLLVAAGGVTVAQIQMGSSQGVYGDEPRFLGFPVRTVQKMSANSAVNQIACYFGSLSLAAIYGDRRQNTIAMSEHAGFAQDELQIRGTTRFDINVHDLGNASATASARVPGPLVGLITASS
jgi:HK97 family phage major capsid protein